MSDSRPRIIIAALRGGSGKTILSLGLIAAFREKGLSVAPFKKGPDFIDAGWLAFAADRPCFNLDPFLMSESQILNSFCTRSAGADISVIEGNRGLYDGLDMEGCCSTAELAKLLRVPVLMIVDVTMATRTVAALVKGCQVFDPELSLGGVILNRVAGKRQENLIRQAIEKYCDLPVLGAVPKLKGELFPERHMGLVPYQERGQSQKAIDWARKAVLENLSVGKILQMTRRTESLKCDGPERETGRATVNPKRAPRIGVIKDRAFWFYYPENLRQLEKMGAVLFEVNALTDAKLPGLDALYIGGGFPETQASALAANQSFRDSLRKEIENGLPVYAECGGLMYLGESLVLEDAEYPMVGALSVKFVLEEKPQGHGYTVLQVQGPNPFYREGELLKGHEFHYSKAIITSGEGARYVFKVRRGHGLDGDNDGLCRKNLLGVYTHIHAAGDPRWARRLIKVALQQGEQGDKS
jgi:cobyrinic acid a,c-diamide synthase